jgi:hypothetical protein
VEITYRSRETAATVGRLSKTLDSRLQQFIAPERGAALAAVALVVDGLIIIGTPSAPSRWDEHVNLVLEQRAGEAEQEPESADVAAALRSLTIEPSDDDDDRYITLRNAAIRGAGAVLEVPAIRVDSERVSAWFVDKVTVPEAGTGEDDENGHKRLARRRAGQ